MVGNIYTTKLAMFGIAAVLMVLASLVVTESASATNHYAPNRTGAKEFAVDFCKKNNIGMADFVWLSAPGSEDETTVSVTYPNTVVDVQVNVFTTYCAGYPDGAEAGSKYESSKGGVVGTFFYKNEKPGNTWYDSQIKQMNVDKWGSGNHQICMTLTSWSAGLTPVASPSACSVINLNVIYPWQSSGWSLVGVGNGSPNVNEWPANPPLPEIPAQPGSRLYWRHGVKNDGPSSTSSINFSIGKSGFSNGWNAISSPTGSFSLASGNTQRIGYGESWDDYSIYDVTQGDVGKTLCQGVNWSPVNNSGGSGSSDPACVAVPYNFRLTPTADAPTNAAESGASITITPSLSNVGPTKSYDSTSWQLLKFILPPAPGVAVPAAGESSSACAPSWPSCQKLSDGSGTYSLTPPSLGSHTYTVEDLPLGTRVCFAVSVNKFSASRGSGKDSDDWWNGTPDCMVVGKKPKLQVWGDDVAVRGSIITSTTQKDTGVFGSWVEYAAFSVGYNNQFASGAGLVDQTSSSQASWSALTFANANVVGGSKHGQFKPASVFRKLPSIAQFFSIGKPTQPYDSGADLNANAFDTGGSVVVRTAGALELNAGNLPKGRSLVIVATDTVTIKGDLTYQNGAMTTVRELSQLVIIAPRIHIEDGVTRVDAWLVAEDEVNTCSNVAGSLTGKVCEKQLTINGPIVAGDLLLRRTFGSGTGSESGTPAEIFNMRPDAHLWAQLVAVGSGRAETVDTVELPPRF